MSPAFEPKDIQGNILRGYRRKFVRHLILEVVDGAAARKFLAAAAAGGSAASPAITSEQTWSEKPPTCFNLGVTYAGLRALGTPGDVLATFPTEFKEGMNARALKLGDFGPSAPEAWPAPFDEPARIHIIATIHADDPAAILPVQAQVEAAFRVIGFRDGRNLEGGKTFFGYRDGISQPRFTGVADPDQAGVKEPIDPLGTVLLGHPTRLEGLRFAVPQPAALGFNGSFNAFRILEQDAAGFEDYLIATADKLLTHPKVDLLLPPGGEARIGAGLGRELTRSEALREVVAAQMCGRWRDDFGTPYALSPDAPDSTVSLTNFGYERGSRCPAGAHIRRTHPRGSQIVQRIANYTRRLVRRGMSYGPDFDPAKPDRSERGLLGNFIGASLGAQFEAVQYDWLNLGLQDPDITGSNDALVGANVTQTSWFDLSLAGGESIRLRGFPRFVTTRGGAYAFLPSLPAIRWMAKLSG